MARHIARRHHYLPASYLAGFTTSGKKNGQFSVIEVETGRSFRTSPKNVAVERDFNRVDIDGMAPDVIENALAPFEQEAVQAIANIVNTGNFPKGMDYHRIINLLCLIAVRNPSMRESFNRSKEQTLRIIADLLVSDEQTWEQHKRAAEFSSEGSTNVSREEMRRFVKEGKYRIEFPTDSNLAVEFETFNEILPVLGRRNWSLFLAPKHGSDFICCDHPVSLTWKNQGRGPIGFALRRTEVFFPLARQAGFFGVFEDPLDPVVKLTPFGVASMNARIARSAERHLFCAESQFEMLRDGAIKKIKFLSEHGG